MTRPTPRTALPFVVLVALAAALAACATDDTSTTGASAAGAASSEATEGVCTGASPATTCGGEAQADPATWRIVSLGDGVTRSLCALDLCDAIVAVDASSALADERDDIVELAYHRMVSAEAVIALAPTHVVHMPSAGPPAALDQIRAAGVHVVEVQDPVTVGDARARILSIGDAFGRDEAADALVAELVADAAALTRAHATRDPVRAAFLYARGPTMMLVGGRETAANAMLDLAGLANAFAGLDGFVPLTPEALVAAAPDVLVIPDGGLASVGGLDGLGRIPGVASTPAWAAERVVTMDDQALLSFGPDHVDAAAELRTRVDAAMESPR